MDKIGEKILEKAVDIVLVSLYFNLEFPKYARGKRWKIEDAIVSDLENFDYRSLKQAFNNLVKKGLIQTFKDSSISPKITEIGKKKLTSVIPFYDEKRIWDGRVYLVTYDLPREKNNLRNILRLYLRKIGAGMLQQSVWITPYNPTDILKKFFEEKDLNELVIISSIGKDGTIGDIDLKQLMEKVYDLSSLNERYREFIVEAEKNKLTPGQCIFNFLSILNDDPQLPFTLLPENWIGQKAYFVFKRLKHLEGK